MPYDICVVGTGGINNTRGISGSTKFAMPFKTAGHCHSIGQRLKKLNRRNRRVSVVVAGGGLEGIVALGTERYLSQSSRRCQGNDRHFYLEPPFQRTKPPSLAFIWVGIPLKSRAHLRQR